MLEIRLQSFQFRCGERFRTVRKFAYDHIPKNKARTWPSTPTPNSQVQLINYTILNKWLSLHTKYLMDKMLPMNVPMFVLTMFLSVMSSWADVLTNLFIVSSLWTKSSIRSILLYWVLLPPFSVTKSSNAHCQLLLLSCLQQYGILNRVGELQLKGTGNPTTCPSLCFCVYTSRASVETCSPRTFDNRLHSYEKTLVFTAEHWAECPAVRGSEHSCLRLA